MRPTEPTKRIQSNPVGGSSTSLRLIRFAFSRVGPHIEGGSRSKSVSNTPTTTTTAPRRRSRIFRKRNVVLFLLLLVGGALCFPPSFQLLLRKSLEFEISRRGVRGTINEIGGSLFSPLVLKGVKLETNFRRAKLTIDRLTASFDPRGLFRRYGDRWLSKLHLDGVSVEFDLQVQSDQVPPQPPFSKSWRPSILQFLPDLTPDNVDVQNSDVVLRMNESFLAASGIRFAFKQNQPGALKIEHVSIDYPFIKKSYSNLSAAIGAQGSNLVLGEMTIEQNLRIRSVSVDLRQLAAKRVELNYDVDAFGGSLGGDITSVGNAGDMNLEGTGTFKDISVPDLGVFLETKSKTAGLLEEGKITFRGLIRHPEKGSATLRIRATDFQWGERKWNLLEAGVTLLNGEVRVHQLELTQAGNQLTASGEIDLPEPGTPWWRQNFELHISAQIGDLAKLSALLGPEAEQATGKIDIDGSIRGSDSSFHGHVIATGSKVSYREVPFDSLTIAARIRGNEVQLRHMELIHGNDFVRGSGVVNILGIKHYWGELKASIADLTDYAPLLVPPVAPTPLGGAVTIEWSGDGNAKAHSGAFRAKFSDLVPLQIRKNSTPLDGHLEATYSPGHIFFSTFQLGSNTTTLNTRVIVSPRSLEFKDLKLTHEKKQRLTGELLLPVNAWAAWASGNSDEVVNASGKCEGNLQASEIPLEEALPLTGKTIPVSGELSGKVVLSGSIDDLNASGELILARGGMTFGDETELSKLQLHAVLNGNQLAITEASGDVFGGTISGNGTLRLSNLDNPELDLKLKAQGLEFILPGNTEVKVNLDSKLKGHLNSADVTCDAVLIAVSPSEDHLELFSLLAALPPEPGKLFSIKRNPFDGWQLDVQCSQEQTVSLGKAWIRPNLRIEGPAEMPEVTGILEFGDIPIRLENETRIAGSATVFYDSSHFSSPVLAILIATVQDEAAGAAIVGTLLEPRLVTSPAVSMANFVEKVPAHEPNPPLAQTRLTLNTNSGTNPEIPFLEAQILGIRSSTIPESELR